jgi:uncharacterized protein (DUF433 family)
MASRYDPAMDTEELVLLDRIVGDPDILNGKPTIRGTRISVELIVGFLSGHLDVGVLLDAYPSLSREDVSAALSYSSVLVKKRHRQRKLRAPTA